MNIYAAIANQLHTNAQQDPSFDLDGAICTVCAALCISEAELELTYERLCEF